jgi:hypothetical protein
MKKLVLIVVLVWAQACCAVNFEPYVKFGTLDSHEENHKTANSHKVMMATGLNLICYGQIEKVLNLEYWTMAEPPDSDLGVMHDGMVVFGEGTWKIYEKKEFCAKNFVGVGGEMWRRNSDLENGFYGDLYFVDISFGVLAEYKDFYLKAGPFLPVYSSCDNDQHSKGRLGAVASLGLKRGRAKFEIFYADKKFDDFQLEQYGLCAKYRF